jgi:hypothetical protein
VVVSLVAWWLRARRHYSSARVNVTGPVSSDGVGIGKGPDRPIAHAATALRSNRLMLTDRVTLAHSVLFF